MKIRGREITDRTSVQAICDEKWREGAQLEFKESLPADEKITAEVVALANHLGGHLIVGIKEANEKPPYAEQLAPIMNCADEATKLFRKIWDKVDPPVLGIVSHPVVTESDGSGIIIIEVPPSMFGPHRSKLDLHVYAKNDEEKRRLNMTEIHRLVLAFEKREDRIESRFKQLEDQFAALAMATGVVRIRGAAVPLGKIHVDHRTCPRPKFDRYRFTDSLGTSGESLGTLGLTGERPLLRGRYFEDRDGPHSRQASWFSDGSFQLTHYTRAISGEWLYAELILGFVASVATSIDRLRQHIGYQELPYGVEIELLGGESSQLVRLGGRATTPAEIGEFLEKVTLNRRMKLPRITYESPNQQLEFVNAIWTDIWNVLGAEPTQLMAKIELLDR